MFSNLPFFVCQWIRNHLYYILFFFPGSLLLCFHLHLDNTFYSSTLKPSSRKCFTTVLATLLSFLHAILPVQSAKCLLLFLLPVSPSVSWTVLASCWAALCAGHILLHAAGPTLPQSLRSGSWRGGERWLSPFSLMIWWEGRQTIKPEKSAILERNREKDFIKFKFKKNKQTCF